MEIIGKDIYLKIAILADDRDTVTMLKVNKKYNQENYFKQVLECKYPFLYKLKNMKTSLLRATYVDHENYQIQSYKKFYIEQTNCIITLKERYNFPYVPVISFDPKYLLNRIENSEMCKSYCYRKNLLFCYYSEAGDIKNIQKMIMVEYETVPNLIHPTMAAIKSDKLSVVKYFVDIMIEKEGLTAFLENVLQPFIFTSLKYNKTEIFNYLFAHHKRSPKQVIDFRTVVSGEQPNFKKMIEEIMIVYPGMIISDKILEQIKNEK